MLIQTSEYINVRQRALELGLKPPTGLALLPRGFETAKTRTDLVYESTAADIRALWRGENLTETRVDEEKARVPYIQEKKYEWILPPLFVGAALWSKQPEAITIALCVVGNYLTDFLKGRPYSARPQDIEVDVVIERTKNGDLKIHYKGPVKELNALTEKVLEVVRDERKN
jgi:hypothetical protein